MPLSQFFCPKVNPRLCGKWKINLIKYFPLLCQCIIFYPFYNPLSLCNALVIRDHAKKKHATFQDFLPQSVSNVVWQMGNQGPKLVIMTLTVRHKKISSSTIMILLRSELHCSSQWSILTNINLFFHWKLFQITKNH